MSKTHPHPQALNPLIDAADALLTLRSADEAWLKSVELVHQNGGNALNVAELECATGMPIWFRSSMNSEWLEDYVAQDFVTCDPLILSAKKGNLLSRMIDGRMVGVSEPDDRTNDLADQIVAWGYQTMDFYAYASTNNNTFKGLTFSYDSASEQRDTDQKLLCALIASVVFAPQNTKSPGATPFLDKALTVREQDVLRYLAMGLRNDAVAAKLGVAEITVRVHITSARRKLGAATREQAIALAIKTGQLHL